MLFSCTLGPSFGVYSISWLYACQSHGRVLVRSLFYTVALCLPATLSGPIAASMLYSGFLLFSYAFGS